MTGGFVHDDGTTRWTHEDNMPSRADELRAAKRSRFGEQQPAGEARIPGELERVVGKARELIVEEGFSVRSAAAAAAVLETTDPHRWADLYGMTRALLSEARSGR